MNMSSAVASISLYTQAKQGDRLKYGNRLTKTDKEPRHSAIEHWLLNF